MRKSKITSNLRIRRLARPLPLPGLPSASFCLTRRAFNCLCIAGVLVLGNACSTTRVHQEANHVAVAKRYFGAIYGCHLSVIDELTSKDVVISYPIFQTLYHTPAIRGREAVKRFAANFCSKWRDAIFTIEDTVEQGDQMAVVWSFQARYVGGPRPGEPPDNQLHCWGGISLLRFDPTGRIVAEIGEESEPGPTARLKGNTPTTAK